MKIMRNITLAFLVLLASACADDEGGSSSGSDGSSSSSETCERDWSCLNGSCECTNEGVEGDSCCDPDECSGSDACDVRCEVCD